MSKATYVFGQNADGAERERLAHFAAFLDPYTARRLDHVGIAPGWRCLEIGAGQGSVATMLADRVGPSGAVFATDIESSLSDRVTSQC